MHRRAMPGERSARQVPAQRVADLEQADAQHQHADGHQHPALLQALDQQRGHRGGHHAADQQAGHDLQGDHELGGVYGADGGTRLAAAGEQGGGGHRPPAATAAGIQEAGHEA
ncbi:hypothetical protein G6F59_017540 [Rhizopus arrhizus]|nr:hypothetical protein G6F59_017540 [Rhizopus arrhizus]